MAENDLILMASDDENFVFLARLALQRAQLHALLVAVNDGVELIDYLQGVYDLPGHLANKVPSIVILDAHLRLLTSSQVLQWIRMQPKFASLPVVILAGSPLEIRASRSRRLAVADYENKPPTMENLVALMHRLHERHFSDHATAGRKAA